MSRKIFGSRNISHGNRIHINSTHNGHRRHHNNRHNHFHPIIPIFGFGHGYRRPIIVQNNYTNGNNPVEEIYEEDGKKYGVSWNCNSNLKNESQHYKKTSSILYIIMLIILFSYPIFSFIFYGILYIEDIIIVTSILLIIFLIAISIKSYSNEIDNNCYNTREIID